MTVWVLGCSFFRAFGTRAFIPTLTGGVFRPLLIKKTGKRYVFPRLFLNGRQDNNVSLSSWTPF
jgi:hypothetical protein